MTAGDFERVCSGLIVLFVSSAMAMIWLGWPSIALVLLFPVILFAALIVVRLL